MKIQGEAYRSIWVDPTNELPTIIDQTELPHALRIRTLDSVESAAEAIETMRVRGAPLIGATAAHGMSLAAAEDPSLTALEQAAARLLSTRPTAVNLRWALDRMLRELADCEETRRADVARTSAVAICDEDAATCEAIGRSGHAILVALAERKESGEPLNILTHCNAGWLATVDWGTALSPIYKAQEAGLDLHVWVDETRPRNQGSSLTAFELEQQGIPHTVIVDNAGGHLMQHGKVDAVIVGSDRTTAGGDVCNKIGTYLKALAAHDNGVPFYAALPLSTIDWTIDDGVRDIPIEERGVEEVRVVCGTDERGETVSVELFAKDHPVANPAFDVTPRRYVSGIITENGVASANAESLAELRSG